jgi:hypothetical protein
MHLREKKLVTWTIGASVLDVQVAAGGTWERYSGRWTSCEAPSSKWAESK